ncbi:MAG: BACON domain-containing protein [Oscillospiraceae bacterium]|nr:BACON domain-containing protein [Oscillospiraceae bacterium]
MKRFIAILLASLLLLGGLGLVAAAQSPSASHQGATLHAEWTGEFVFSDAINLDISPQTVNLRLVYDGVCTCHGRLLERWYSVDGESWWFIRWYFVTTIRGSSVETVVVFHYYYEGVRTLSAQQSINKFEHLEYLVASDEPHPQLVAGETVTLTEHSMFVFTPQQSGRYYMVTNNEVDIGVLDAQLNILVNGTSDDRSAFFHAGVPVFVIAAPRHWEDGPFTLTMTRSALALSVVSDGIRPIANPSNFILCGSAGRCSWQFHVTATTPWTVTADVDWLVLAVDEQSNTFTVSEPHNDGEERNAVVTVTTEGNDEYYTLVFTQRPHRPFFYYWEPWMQWILRWIFFGWIWM